MMHTFEVCSDANIFSNITYIFGTLIRQTHYAATLSQFYAIRFLYNDVRAIALKLLSILELLVCKTKFSSPQNGHGLRQSLICPFSIFHEPFCRRYIHFPIIHEPFCRRYIHFLQISVHFVAENLGRIGSTYQSGIVESVYIF